MFNRIFIVICCGSIALACGFQRPAKPLQKGIDILFYNLENLFDTIDDPETADEEYLPYAEKKWDTEKYQTKIKNLAKVITSVNDGDLPDLMGFCELEHRSNIEDLQKEIKASNYAISHFESPDARGIDVALLYNRAKFTLISEKAIYVSLYVPDDLLENKNNNEALDLLKKNGTGRTRNILFTKLAYTKDTFCVFVCHFPSRREGKESSSYKREMVATKLKQSIDQETAKNANAKIIVLGDFNDEPSDFSMEQVLQAGQENQEGKTLYNLFYKHHLAKDGSYKFRDQMNMLDQIIISKNLWNQGISAKIYHPDWLKQTGKYEGYPLRSFGGNKYLAGYSDHFPVFVTLP